MTSVHRGLGAALALVSAVAIAWVSRAPMIAHRSPEAMLRLAWSARPERIEKCREQSEEELAGIPQHMRQPVACEGVTAEYRLVVRVDGRVVADRPVHGGGLRRDRRVFVLEEFAVPAGEALIEVRLDRIEADTEPPAAATTDRGELPRHLAFAERLRFSPRNVVLVTYDSTRRTLVAMTK